MRKTLIGFLLAGAMIAPAAASAQDGREPRNRHVQQEDHAGSRQDADQRQQARSEQRAARMEARQQRIQSAPAEAQVSQRGEGRRGWRGGDGRRGGDGYRGDRSGRRGNASGQSAPTASGYQRGWQGPAGTENSDIARRYNRRAQENAIRYGTRDQRRDAIRDYRNDRREARRDWRGDRRDWNRSWRNDRRYAWQDWRYRNRDLFRLGRYYSPYPRYGYRRFSIGLFLDPLFFGQRYWIGDPFYYRLPPAPPGTQWIRYYNDVLLVDVYSGEVLDVIHDFFW